MKRKVRPEFNLIGEGSIKVLGAEMRGKGEIKSLPSPNQSEKSDFFEVNMEGNLLWQGRKWLGGKISVGSRGLSLSGTTNFGLKLTPSNLPGTNVKIASLFLQVQMEGELKLDKNKKLTYFMFIGFWTLGAAMAGTGNSTNKQMLPLASSQFVFTSNAGLNTNNEYFKELFRIDGFSFFPFDDTSIALPTITVQKKDGAITLLQTGKRGSSSTAPAVVEFYTPLGYVGFEGPAFVPPYFNNLPRALNQSKNLYSAYEVRFDDTPININFNDFSNIKLLLVLESDPNKNFPMKLKLESEDAVKYISF
ncbi:MAG: hypothetical protein AAGE96_13835 [Cyanobacteria bacterium P01_G01_bin.19]